MLDTFTVHIKAGRKQNLTIPRGCSEAVYDHLCNALDANCFDPDDKIVPLAKDAFDWRNRIQNSDASTGKTENDMFSISFTRGA